jgi:hypothetical protein|tara:strand:- start:169 stop:366 length:198 start_codon:yes stop_codon:yes gene_type:complete
MSRSENNSFEYLRDKLRSQMNDLSDHISGGACKDYNEYAKCCGVIEGLALAERELLDLKSKLEAE